MTFTGERFPSQTIVMSYTVLVQTGEGQMDRVFWSFWEDAFHVNRSAGLKLYNMGLEL